MDTKHVHMLREDHGKTEEADVRKPQRNHIYQNLILDHRPPEWGGGRILLVKSVGTHYVKFSYDIPSKLI